MQPLCGRLTDRCIPPPLCLFLPLLPAAAIARRVYIRQGMGVGGFRRAFGGRSNAAGSTAPEHHAKAAGGIIRHALQQLEAMGLVEKNPAAQGGRRITAEGQRQVRDRSAAAGPPISRQRKQQGQCMQERAAAVQQQPLEQQAVQQQ